MTDETMSEGKAKKPGLLRQILWWIWVILLSGLLLLCLIFAAPWKVITLIVIFLAAATILPRIYRKWLWAAVAFAFFIFVGWVLAPADHEGWEPYKYDFSSKLAKLEQQREIPPADNAALDYLALLKEDDGNDANLTERFFRVYDSPWKSSDHPDAAESLEKHSQTIKKLMDISQKQECRFPLNNPEMPYFDTTRHLAFGRWADLLAAVCNKDIGEGRIEQAIEKAAVIAQIGRHQIQQGTHAGVILGIGRKSLAYDLVRPLIMNGLDEEKLSMVQNTICAPDNDWESAWSRMLEYDKLVAACKIASYYEINQNGLIRLSRDPQWSERIRFRNALSKSDSSDANEPSNPYKVLFRPFIYKMAYPSWSETKLLKAGTLVQWLFLPASPDDAFTFIQKRGIFSRARRTQDRMHKSLLQSHKRCMAYRKGTLLMVALKRYKDAFSTWPKNLTEIKPLASPDTFIDPLNNGEFVYKLTDKGFTLYSKGLNGIDEKGQFGESHDDWMIWPLESCGKISKQQEQKTSE